MTEKRRSKSNFDKIWKEDFLDLKEFKLSRTAFILRQLYRLHRNIQTSETKLSDLKIHQITGFGRPAISRAKNELLRLGFMQKLGYHHYKMRGFDRYDD